MVRAQPLGCECAKSVMAAGGGLAVRINENRTKSLRFRLQTRRSRRGNLNVHTDADNYYTGLPIPVSKNVYSDCLPLRNFRREVGSNKG